MKMRFEEKKFPRLKDCLPITNGVFGHMEYSFRNEVTKAQLDYLLMADAAQRNPAPVIDLIYDEEEPGHHGQLTDAELNKLAALMLAYYKPRWDKLGDIYDIEYDPIHNYLDEWEDENDGRHADERVLDSDRDDTLNTTVTKSGMRTDNLTQKNTGSVTNGKTGTEADAHTGTVGDSGTETGTDNVTHTGTVGDSGTHSSTDSLWGFNSSNAVNTDATSGMDGNTRTDNLTDAETRNLANSNTRTFANTDTTTFNTTEQRSDNLTQTNTGTQSTSGSEATTGTNSRATDETETTSGTDHRERAGRHFGNIGNLTSQKMLNEEIELWKWNYVRSILDDAIKFLTLDIYL